MRIQDPNNPSVVWRLENVVALSRHQAQGLLITDVSSSPTPSAEEIHAVLTQNGWDRPRIERAMTIDGEWRIVCSFRVDPLPLLKGALQGLVDCMREAEEHIDPDTGEPFDSWANAVLVLSATLKS